MESSKIVSDDLRAISGIGPARQRWLRDSFNARTYQDVAGLSVDRIESRLKADRQIVSRTAIEAWLIQARELATRADRRSRSGQDAVAEPAANADHSITKEDGWEPFASFVIEFQAHGADGQVKETRTAIHHIESDSGTYWPGIATSQVCQWMLDKLPAGVQTQGQESHCVQTKRFKTPVAEKVKIIQIRVFQTPQTLPPQHIEAGETFQGSIRGGQPFTFEVDFELDVAAAAGKAKSPIECNARSFAYDLKKQASISLGETEFVALDEGQPTCTFTLPETTLPRGEYRLWVLVTPKEARFVLPDYVEVPVFQVT